MVLIGWLKGKVLRVVLRGFPADDDNDDDDDDGDDDDEAGLVETFPGLSWRELDRLSWQLLLVMRKDLPSRV